MNKIQNSKQNRFGHLKLVLGAYLGFGIWNLEFYGQKEREGRDRKNRVRGR